VSDGATEILPPPPKPADAAADGGALIGRTLGKLTIVEPLGRGGSGEVYRAEQVQLGRSAVIKVLRRDVARSPLRIDRFLREAQLASRLDHPYAAHIYGFGAEPDGLLWIAMEHVRGATLDDLVVRRGAMPPAIFGPLFGRLCEVVHTAHELGIVHRDLKGANVMVIERAGQLLPKLLDFGIAKVLHEADEATSTVT
jgi:serine/threonine-protein kinase